MANPPDAPPPQPPPGPRLVLGGWSLAGPAALIVAVLLLTLFVGLVVWSRPTIGMLLAGGVWLGYLLYWSATAGRREPGRSAESPRSRTFHQNLLNLGLLLLFVPIPGLKAYFLPPNQWHVQAGLAIMAVSTLLHVWARVHLGRNWSGQVAIRQGHELVRTGPYRVVRHPVYTAILGLAIGTAVVSERVLSIAGVLVFAIAYVRKLRLEERALGDTFGAAWEEYRKRSWALVPGVY